MVLTSGIAPALEGATSTSPEGAMRKLLLATSEFLDTIMVSTGQSEPRLSAGLTSFALKPKVGSHQRNIHGGGVVDEDFISRDLLDKKA